MDEAPILARYLLGENTDQDVLALFEKAKRLRPIPMTESDTRIMEFVRKYPWSVGFLDSALAILRPAAALRQKLFVMTAILEARPRYCDRFLPVDRSRFYGATIIFVCLRAALKGIAGFALLAFAR
jgi:hypothetical protein